MNSLSDSHVHVCSIQKAAAANSRLIRMVSEVDAQGRGQGSYVLQETVDFLNYSIEVRSAVYIHMY